MARIRDSFTRPPSGWKVTDPITNIKFSSNSYRNLVGEIETHRRANDLPTDGIEQFIADQICEKNDPYFCVDAGPSPRLTNYRAPTNQEMWAVLHTRALSHEGEDDTIWFNVWCDRVPSQGCTCKSNWKKLVKEFPPIWSDYFAWSNLMHNKVSQSIGKPTLSLEQARAIWLK